MSVEFKELEEVWNCKTWHKYGTFDLKLQYCRQYISFFSKLRTTMSLITCQDPLKQQQEVPISKNTKSQEKEENSN